MLMLKEFQLDLTEVSDEDVVAYISEVNDYVEAMKSYSQGELQKSTNLFFEMIKKQIRLLEKNKDYEGMKQILKDSFQRSDLQEIYKNLAPYQDISQLLTNEMAELRKDAEFAKKHTEAFINSLLRTKYMVRRLNSELVKLIKDPNSKDNVATVFYYNNVINYWENFLDDFQQKLDNEVAEGNITTDNPIYELVGSINSEIMTSRNHTSKIYLAGTSEIIKDTIGPMREQIDKRFAELMDDLKKRNAPQDIIEMRQKDYWGLSGEPLRTFLGLKAKMDSGTTLTSAEKNSYETLKMISYKDGAFPRRLYL